MKNDRGSRRRLSSPSLAILTTHRLQTAPLSLLPRPNHALLRRPLVSSAIRRSFHPPPSVRRFSAALSASLRCVYLRIRPGGAGAVGKFVDFRAPHAGPHALLHGLHLLYLLLLPAAGLWHPEIPSLRRV